MKLLILSLLTSVAISAAIGGAGVEARAGPTACNCKISFPGRIAVYRDNIPALPGKTSLSATYDITTTDGHSNEFTDACFVTWDRGQKPTVCSTWKQTAGPSGPKCPKSIQVYGKVKCEPAN
ncbi:hypothetical protein WAI453_005666 [Rhynchosporium graminicola]|uniref:AA1-like domain-containing protein n=1 Tax=Rhynchosporium graminicola TaxID=2792576 RepID=A0A1E1LFK6_9HELO|nr:uncharacterized protein RCO7_04066 [Rhynchosporium commune]